MAKDVNLAHKLTLERLSRQGDGAGGFSESWAQMAEIWGDVIPRAGRESARGGGFEAKVGYRIIVRTTPFGSDARPQTGDRLRSPTQVFEVNAVSHDAARAMYLQVWATEQVQA